MMPKITEVNRKSAVFCQFDDFAHCRHVRWRSVGRQPHNLILVSVMRKPEILGEGLVKDAERVGKIHSALDRDISSLTDTPCRAGEVAEAIDRHDHRFFEWRHVER